MAGTTSPRAASLKLTQGGHYADTTQDGDFKKLVKLFHMLAGSEVEIQGPTPAVAGTAFIVEHDLGVTPDRVVTAASGNQGGLVYATERDKRSWTEKDAKIRCTVARETNLWARFTENPG